MIAWTSQVSSYFVYVFVFVVHMNCKSLSSSLAQLLLYTKSSATTHKHPYSTDTERHILDQNDAIYILILQWMI